MEKRLLLAVALSFVVMVGWLVLVPSPAPEPIPPAAVAEGPAQGRDPAPPAATHLPRPAFPVPVERVASEKPEEVSVETDLFQIMLTSQGARVASWRLKAYAAADGRPVDLVSGAVARGGEMPFSLDLDDPSVETRVNEALYVVSREPSAGEGASGERIRFTWAEGGVRVVKSLAFREGDYLVDVGAEVTVNGVAIPARLTWGPGLAAQDSQTSGQFHYVGQAVVNDSGRVARIARDKPDGETKQRATNLLWAGLEEQYFAALYLPATGNAEVVLRPTASPGTEKGERDLVVAVSMPAEGGRLFVGPKRFALLRSLGRQMEEVVWFSNYSLISWLAKMFFLALAWINDRLVQNYGLAVILLTVALRVVLFPVNQYSMVSMKKMQTQMQRIQPKVNAIKNRFKKKDAESRSKMNQEMMALYQKEGVNPMGSVSGCLPMFAQFPILIAFYDMLVATVELRGAPFVGWIHDLTQKDPYYVTPILMGATMFLQQWMGTTKAADPAQAQQQKIMLMMPVIFTVMFLNLPSGLVLYWLVNNVLGIAQQWLVNRHIGRLEAAAQKA